MSCSECGEPTHTGDVFCEACGHELATSRGSTTSGEPSREPCPACGEPETPGEPYCLGCGRRRDDGTDHVQVDLGTAGAVSDRGRRHHRNEDAVALARCDTLAGSAYAVVVCDGVSTADRPQDASHAAADAASESLVKYIHSTEGRITAQDAYAALDAAIADATTAVLALGSSAHRAPACTIVAAVVDPAATTGATVHLAWLGDSRAYWLRDESDTSGTPSRVLTRDHTVAAELVAGSAVEEGFDPENGPGAHVITRWVGTDAPEGITPERASVEVTGNGLLLVCSDGLWNYLSPPTALEEALRDRWTDTAVDLAEHLTAVANDAGGRDNITVAIVRIDAESASITSRSSS